MKLFAISDLHLHNRVNWEAFADLPAYPEDWLLLGGDVAETEGRFRLAISFLANRFQRVFWTPGNHDLWTLPQERSAQRGVAKYESLVGICREAGVVTPEDEYVQWPGGGWIAPIFTLYDYTFCPPPVTPVTAVAWAAESGIRCTDEDLLHPDPYPSLPAWSRARVRHTEERLATIPPEEEILLLSHFPLRQDLVHLPRVPRFTIWCGTKATESWLTRFSVKTVVYGHLHIRATRYRDGVRYEEVSLGYPRQWQSSLGITPYLRQIW